VDPAPVGRVGGSDDVPDAVPAGLAHRLDGREDDGGWVPPAGGQPAGGGRARGLPSPAAPARQPARLARGRLASLVLLAAGLAAAGAAFAPWSTLATNNERRTFTGLTVGDGRFTVLLGIALAVLGLAGLARRRLSGDGFLGVLLAGLLVVIAGSDLLIGPPTLATFRGISADQIAVEPESGLYLSVAAGVLALLAALMPLRGAPADPRGDGPELPPTPIDPRRQVEAPAQRPGGDHRAGRAHE